MIAWMRCLDCWQGPGKAGTRPGQKGCISGRFSYFMELRPSLCRDEAGPYDQRGFSYFMEARPSICWDEAGPAATSRN